VRGSDSACPHGVPLDLLDRTLVIPTAMYSGEEMGRILQLRMDEEGIKVNKKRSFLVETN
jgi:RuvB-like protein 2